MPQIRVVQPPKKDNRRAITGGAFVVLGIAALILGWWGVVLGVGLLGWAIAGALGKVKGPINLIFPKSARNIILAVAGIGLGSFVTMCGVMGGLAKQNNAEKEARRKAERAEREAAEKVEKEQREAEEATAMAALEAELRKNAPKAAGSFRVGLEAVEAMIAEKKWGEADKKMKEVTVIAAEYRELSPVPEEIAVLLPRYDALIPKLEIKRREWKIQSWIEHAEEVVRNRDMCEDKSEVDAARKQVVGLQESDANYAKVQDLNAKLDECLKNMPPPSKWRYKVRNDPMGGTVATAFVTSSNTLNFGFPYQGTQNATLLVRRDKGTDVMVSIEKGQFMCTMGCSVKVRFDDGETKRWRANGPSDHSTETLFLRKESSFLKLLKKAEVVRIEADFFQEGTRVLEFPVARFNASKLK